MKKFMTIFVITVILIINTPAYAHTNSQAGILEKEYISDPNYQDWYIGGEGVGWSVDEGCHTNGYYIRYKLSSNVGPTVSGYVTAARSSWTGAGNCPISVEPASNAPGTIEEADLSGNLDGRFCQAHTGSNGHLTSWKIQINTDNIDEITYAVVVHEFGHAIGLNDLYTLNNKNKIMYYKRSRTVADPQTQDKWGVKVITGYHTSHTWSYVFYHTNGGINQHRRRCTSCKGIKYNSVENCTYNASGVCTKCGTPQGNGNQSIGLPEITGMSLWEEQRRAFRFLVKPHPNMGGSLPGRPFHSSSDPGFGARFFPYLTSIF